MLRTPIAGLLLLPLVFAQPGGAPQPAQHNPPAHAEPRFPESWAGHWKGDAVSGVDGRMQKFTMELDVAPTEDASRFRWTLIYDGAAGRQERPYTLLMRDAAKGMYAIDEGNSIVLEARLIDGTLYTHFLVQGNRITTRQRLESDGTGARIDVEMVTTIDDKGTETGNAQGAPAVKTWTPVSVQKAVLRKLDERK